MRRLCTIEEFVRLAPNEQETAALTGFAVGGVELGESGRIIRYRFSTPAVGRDLHTVAADAWDVDNYVLNPVFLWAHDDTMPPIGRVVQIATIGVELRGAVEYAEADLNPFADMIYRMVKAGYINATSTSWLPLDWTPTKDRSRPGGIDFKQVDLLEISNVPVPAMPDALAQARSAGIDLTPMKQWAERILDLKLEPVPRGELEAMRAVAMPKPVNRAADAAEWKVGAAKDLPVEDSDSWDGAAAEKSIFEYAGGDEFDSEKARKGFLVYNAAEPDKRGSYKLPIAHAVEGELKVPKGAIRAAASRLSQTDIPDEVKTSAGAVLDHYKEKAGIGENDDGKERALKTKRAITRSGAEPIFKRGLYDAGRLCFLLEELGYAHFSATFEAEMEGDGSALPGMLKEILEALGKACIEMTAEEVGEFLAMHGPVEDEEEADAEARALKPAARAFIAAAKTPRVRAFRLGIAIARAGKELSVNNKDHLQSAQDNHKRALKHHEELGEHHESMGNHVDAAQEGCERTTQTLAELGEHVRAAKENPEEAGKHLDAASKSHGEAEEHMGAVAKAHQDAQDSHADADDCHRMLGRRVKGAQRCVRAVLDGAAVTSDADEPGADDLKKQQEAKTEKARAAARERRAARAKELQRREPTTID